MKKTLRDVGLVASFFRLKEDEMDIHLIPPNKLDPLLTNLLLTVRKKRMDVISSQAPCAPSLVVWTRSYDEQNMGT
jgi:hypothetical protein